MNNYKHFQFSKYFRQSKRYSKQNIFFLSNLLQESVNKTNVLAAFSTDHSPLLFSLGLSKDENRGKTLWKFINFFCMNSYFVTKMKYHIKTTLEIIEKKGITDFQTRWEFLKYWPKTLKKKQFFKKISSKN